MGLFERIAVSDLKFGIVAGASTLAFAFDPETGIALGAVAAVAVGHLTAK